MGARREFRTIRARKLVSALAVTALALVLLRPVCDAYAAHAAHERSQDAHTARLHSIGLHAGEVGDTNERCCTRLADAALVVPSDLGPPVATGAEQPTLTAARISPIDSAHAVQMQIARGAIPPSHSYYARSARILR